jgi:TPR repeat protein
MQKVLFGIGAAVIVAVAVGGVVFLSPQPGLKAPAVTAAVADTVREPMGEKRNRKDPGEEHYIQGRYPEAVAYWTEAAGKGDVYAAHRLGVEYMDGKPWVVQRDYVKALQFHKQAALGGYSLSMFDLGSIFEFGFGSTVSLKDAARWYGHSADYGLAQGQYNYATMLEAGEGVAKDAARGVFWFRKAAEQGHADAQCNLGLCLQRGDGVAQDSAQALVWFRKAAEQGHADAQRIVGLLLLGAAQGVPRDARAGAR